MLIDGMHGMGDCIFQRAFLRELKGQIYLRTSWPQIYKDLPNILPVRPVRTKLRTQNKNVIAQPASTWHNVSAVKKKKKIGYGAAALRRGSILSTMKSQFGIEAKTFDMPEFSERPVDGKYAIVRPVTARAEWLNPARSPHPEYVSEATEILKAKGIKTVSVADLADGAEWADILPECDVNFNHGELNFEKLMGLVQGASLIVGGVGWVVPAASACGVPLVCLLGGQGGHNAPEKITDHPMDLSKVRWIRPDNYCHCAKMRHDCDKTVSDFANKFENELESLCVI